MHAGNGGSWPPYERFHYAVVGAKTGFPHAGSSDPTVWFQPQGLGLAPGERNSVAIPTHEIESLSPRKPKHREVPPVYRQDLVLTKKLGEPDQCRVR